jgi:hypothetical protein
MISAENIPEMEGGGTKESSRGGKFKYDIFNTLQKILQMPQCTPIQNN